MSRYLFRFAFLLNCILLLSTGFVEAQNASIWITGPLEKVLKTNTTPGGAQSLQISAARNEFVDFQVHALPTATPVQMNVTVSDLTNAQANYVISSATNVFLYREAYLDITTLSDQNGTFGGTPDPLIPTVDPYFGQARNAFPVNVPANQTQSAWIDILVPSSAPPGYYSGTVTISDGSTVIGKLSVQLEVWAFTLPSTATLKSAFGVSGDPNGLCIQAYGAGSDNGYSECAQYPGSGANSDAAIELIHRSEAIFALDDRVSISQAIYVGPPSVTWSHFDATYGDLLNGTAPTVLNGAALTEIQYTPPGFELTPSVIQDWVANFTANGWLGSLFEYTCDEPPNGCSWATALSNEQNIHSASPNLRTMVTTNLANATQNGLLPDLNIIVPVVNDMEPQGGSNQRSTYDSFLSGTNRHLWWYQSCESHGSCANGTVGSANSTWPSYMIDASPVRNRVFQWLAFLDNIEAELYYATDYCWYANQVYGSGCGSSDPWASVYAFGGNGDGTLFYPGTAAKIGGTTPVPVPSIRFKLIRDGMQDYEYLMALSKAGQDAFARSTAATFITNAYTFSTDALAMTNARQVLGSRLNQLARPACGADACAHDFNGDGNGDIAWRDTNGNVAVWLMNGSQVLQSVALGAVPSNFSIIGVHDFNGDGKADMLWRDGSGNVSIWFMNGASVASAAGVGTLTSNWTLYGTGDLNGDGTGDLLWRDSNTGTVAVWFMNGATVASTTSFGTIPGNWTILGDANGQVLWRDTAGDIALWNVQNGQVTSSNGLGNVSSNFVVQGVGDFNGDGFIDLLWRDTNSGTLSIWFSNGNHITSGAIVGTLTSNWNVAQIGDYNGDGKSDILLLDSAGDLAVWLMSGSTVSSSAAIGTVGTTYQVQNLNAN